MEYVLKGIYGALTISNIRFYESDIEMPVNTLCRVSVDSGDFRGASDFEIDISGLVTFSVQLKKMYETLQGGTILKETYGRSYVKIESASGGHYKVNGKIDFAPNLLEFEFDIDQTMIREFADDLYKDYAHFASEK